MNKCDNCTDRSTDMCMVCGNISFNSEYTVKEIIELYRDLFTEEEIDRLQVRLVDETLNKKSDE